MYTQNIRFGRRVAPETGLEPVTRRLTAGCSTIELLWNQLAAPSTCGQSRSLGFTEAPGLRSVEFTRPTSERQIDSTNTQRRFTSLTSPPQSSKSPPGFLT